MDSESLGVGVGEGVAVNQKPETANVSFLGVHASGPLGDVRGMREFANLKAVFSNEQNKTERQHGTASARAGTAVGVLGGLTPGCSLTDPWDRCYQSAGVGHSCLGYLFTGAALPGCKRGPEVQRRAGF